MMIGSLLVILSSVILLGGTRIFQKEKISHTSLDPPISIEGELLERKRVLDENKKIKAVKVPDYPEYVYVRSMSSEELVPEFIKDIEALEPIDFEILKKL